MYWNKIFEDNINNTNNINNNLIVWEKYKSYENAFRDFVVQTSNGVFTISFPPVFSDLEIEEVVKIVLNNLK